MRIGIGFLIEKVSQLSYWPSRQIMFIINYFSRFIHHYWGFNSETGYFWSHVKSAKKKLRTLNQKWLQNWNIEYVKQRLMEFSPGFHFCFACKCLLRLLWIFLLWHGQPIERSNHRPNFDSNLHFSPNISMSSNSHFFPHISTSSKPTYQTTDSLKSKWHPSHCFKSA